MASECRNTFVEILDDENNVLPYGQEGRIVTSLFNKAIPFMYDIATLGF
jgi:phenylacetate-CoA ligase